MSCPTCVRNIEAVLDRVPGVDRVQASFGAERVSVDFDPAKVQVQELAKRWGRCDGPASRWP